MLFSEPLFLFVFLPSVLFLYAVAYRGGQARLFVLLVASLLFYAWGEPKFVPVVLVSALADFLVARRIATASVGRKWWLTAGILNNFGILVYYKYLNFISENLNDAVHRLGGHNIPILHIALPIGVSFIVFEKITYIVDVYRRVSAPATGFVPYLTYVMFFPKLLAGPIIKYHEIDQQLRHPGRASVANIIAGFQRFMFGFVKKVLLADTLGGAADEVFGLGRASVGFNGAWLGVTLFALQIYLDFSSYSDMAIGLARMFGFSLRENFNYPYMSGSITEFWRRWHISLTSWIREYLYIPLGGNRVSPAHIYVNLWLCFLASGLWHGASWTYVLWGAYNGLFLVLDRLFLLRAMERLPPVVARAATLLIVFFGWAIFRSTTLDQGAAIMGAMLNPARMEPVIYLANDVKIALVITGFACLLPWLPGFVMTAKRLAEPGGRARPAFDIVLAVLFVFALSKAIADPFRPFLYFRF